MSGWFNWQARLACAIFPALRRLREEHRYCDLDACVVMYVREAAKRLTGGNCTFADDDLSIMEHLARRAIVAGLTDKLAPDVAAKAPLATVAYYVGGIAQAIAKKEKTQCE